MLTRKHFETLAASIEKLARTHYDAAYDMANDIADACAKDNPNFDRCKFFEACGLGGVHFRPVGGIVIGVNENCGTE